MRIEKLLYLVGGLFALATVVYFTWGYLLSFTKTIKTVLLACLTIVFFSLGAKLQETDR